ncbi:spore germination cell wall hydrolase CwlJ-like protein [Bradyrhizobium sp. USDA 4503]
MTEYSVLKAFNTVNRRFKPDDERSNVVKSDDLLAPHTIETLKSRGFIKEKDDKPAPVPASATVPQNKLETSAPAAPATSEK